MDDPRDQDPRRAVAQLVVAIMVADGRITSPEIAALTRLDQLGLGALGPFIETEIEQASREPIDVRAACAALAGASREAAATLLAVLAEIAASDRVLAERERRVYDTVAHLLGVPEGEAAHILAVAAERPVGALAGEGAATPERLAPAGAGPVAGPRQMAAAGEPWPAGAPRGAVAAGDDDTTRLLARARRVLGVALEAGRPQVDAAYLAVAARYDPAGVAALGPEFVALTVRKLAEATAAWELLAAADEPAD